MGKEMPGIKPEKQIQKEVMDYLQWWENLGELYFLRTQSGFVKIANTNRMFKTGKIGAPDIICCWRGRFIGIEVKSSKGRQTEAQKEAQKKIESAGGLYLIVRDLKDLEWLRRE